MTSRASKTIGRLTLLAGMAAAAAAQAQTPPPGASAARPPVIARAEACLRQKVDRVVADEPDIAAAANFLVNYACADEVAGATRFLRNTAYVELFSAAFKAGAAAAAAKPPAQSQGQATGGANPAAAAMMASALMSQLKVDPETGDVTAGSQAGQINAALGQFSNIMGQFLPDNVPVPLRKLAGDLVLEARERHRAK